MGAKVRSAKERLSPEQRKVWTEVEAFLIDFASAEDDD
jgi:hypothetical protein